MDDPADLTGEIGGAPALGRVVVVARGTEPAGAGLPRTGRLPRELMEAVSAAAGRVVRVTGSVTLALRDAIDPEAADTVIVVLTGVDRFADDWAGPRLLARLRARTSATVIAAVPAGDVDGASFAVASGAHLVLTWPTADGDARPRLDAADAIAAELDREGDLSEFLDWFDARHLTRWQPWMLDAAVAAALCADRDRQAQWCNVRWDLDSKPAAQRRLREFRAALAGEVRDEGVLERRAALQVLRRYGRHRPIAILPPPTRSLTHAATAVRRAPQLVHGIASTVELSDLLEVDDVMRHLADQRLNGPGRPPAGAWLTRREYALARVAASRASTFQQKYDLQRSLTAQLDETVLLIHDALDDAGGELP